MKTITLIILSVILTSGLKNNTDQFDYTNYLIIDGIIVSNLFNVRVYQQPESIHLKPDHGIIVLKKKHDLIYEGYMVINNIPYRINNAVCVYTINDRVKGYAYGKMCHYPDQFVKFKTKFNLPK